MPGVEESQAFPKLWEPTDIPTHLSLGKIVHAQTVLCHKKASVNGGGESAGPLNHAARPDEPARYTHARA